MMASATVKKHAQQCTSWDHVRTRFALSGVAIKSDWCDRVQRWQAEPQQGVIDYFSADYPECLKQLSQPPWLLFYIGRKELLNSVQIAIVGSRNATIDGRNTANWLAAKIAAQKVTITSGLATGIDTAAHQGALAAGNSIAVLGCGPDIYYPKRNRGLQQQLAQQGLVISEFVPGTGAQSDQFPRRNRIISCLATGVVVVEAKRRSGSLLTARYALDLGREVGAVPGSIWNPAVEGCHWLIQQGALLVKDVNDVLAWCNLQSDWVEQQINSVETEEKVLANWPLLANVGFEPMSVDALAEQTGLSVTDVAEQLVMLEVEGWVIAEAGGYKKVGRR
ncbi:DNA-protecting protein DprA [Idiomarina tyrosinivorans]|uniref:DNA-protecting protein DprA n=2 Tax=Idiomarina tyrosinivorans TaxID=1445662 RepID=A0A432ZTC5_9GAMM|nr:DNA-protecting protein DprA [Idiomarina tyrosinivorans]